MGFLDKAMAAADQAASRAKEGIEDAQLKRDLTQAYSDLGRLTYSLHQLGEISHPELGHLLQRISEFESGAVTAQPAPGAPPPPAHGAPPPPPPAPPPPGDA